MVQFSSLLIFFWANEGDKDWYVCHRHTHMLRQNFSHSQITRNYRTTICSWIL